MPKQNLQGTLNRRIPCFDYVIHVSISSSTCTLKIGNSHKERYSFETLFPVLPKIVIPINPTKTALSDLSFCYHGL